MYNICVNQRQPMLFPTYAFDARKKKLLASHNDIQIRTFEILELIPKDLRRKIMKTTEIVCRSDLAQVIYWERKRT